MGQNGQNGHCETAVMADLAHLGISTTPMAFRREKLVAAISARLAEDVENGVTSTDDYSDFLDYLDEHFCGFTGS